MVDYNHKNENQKVRNHYTASVVMITLLRIGLVTHEAG